MNNNKIQKIYLKGFTKFLDTQNVEFCNGINVFIGINGVGKTHLLKLLYLFIKSIKNKEFNNSLKDSLLNYFKSDSLSSMISKFSEITDAYINLNAFNYDFDFHFNRANQFETSKLYNFIIPELNPIYIPPQEMLSTYFEFIPIYENNITSYEQTYYDFAKSLMNLELRTLEDGFAKISTQIETEIGGTLTKDRGRFYFNYCYGKIESPILAEGIKKIAAIDYLIKNGSINSKSTIFWDEPEVHINPKLITVLSKVIQSIANEGVQIFISSHDHLLTQQMSLLDEYRATSDVPVPQIKFFVLNENQNGETIIESGSNLTDLQYNPILEEYLNHHDREQEMFNHSFSGK